MELFNDTDKPIFLQIAGQIEDAIFTGTFAEETQIPSTTEISLQFRINPATVLKGMNVLTEEKLIYKKRGVGMFVSAGARERIKEIRANGFANDYVGPMVKEAKKLGLDNQRVKKMVDEEFENEIGN